VPVKLNENNSNVHKHRSKPRSNNKNKIAKKDSTSRKSSVLMTKKKFVNTTESTNNSENFNNPISSETACSKTFLREIDDQQFTKTALFHTPTSLLTKIDLKSLFQPSIFESFPRHSQLKLIKLLPECDRQLDSHGSFKYLNFKINLIFESSDFKNFLKL